MKKVVIMLALMALLSFLFTPTIAADIGPKASATITVIGIDEAYELDILIPHRSLNNPIEYDPDEAYTDTHYLKADYFDYFAVLNGYMDTDGYVSATLYAGAPRHIDRYQDQFELGYFGAPKDFKIAIMTERGHLIISEAIERQMFDASFSYDLSGVDLSEDLNGVGRLNEAIPAGSMISQYLIRLVLTVAVELLVLFIFFYRLKQSYFLVSFVNFFTQSFLTLFVIIAYYYWGAALAALLILILGEIIVFTVESIIYILKLREHSRIRALIYALVANLTSLLLGFFLLIFSL